MVGEEGTPTPLLGVNIAMGRVLHCHWAPTAHTTPPPVIVHDCVKPVAPCLVIQHQSVHAIAAQSTFFAPQGPREDREQRVGGLGPGELCTRHKWQGPAPPRTPH